MYFSQISDPQLILGGMLLFALLAYAALDALDGFVQSRAIGIRHLRHSSKVVPGLYLTLLFTLAFYWVIFQTLSLIGLQNQTGGVAQVIVWLIQTLLAPFISIFQ